MPSNQQQGAGSQNPTPKQVPTLSWSNPQSSSTPAKQITASKPTQPGPKKLGMRAPTKIAMAFAGGLIVGWVITWGWFDVRHAGESMVSESSQTQTQTTAQMATQSASTAAAGNGMQSASMGPSLQSVVANDSVVVPTQQNAGTSVTVSSISATDAVWAVVYEYSNGVLGRVLGAARFTPQRTNGSIDLLRATLPNLQYAVALDADTPDHSFSIKTNAPIVDSTGARVMTQFTAQ